MDQSTSCFISTLVCNQIHTKQMFLTIWAFLTQSLKRHIATYCKGKKSVYFISCSFSTLVVMVLLVQVFCFWDFCGQNSTSYHEEAQFTVSVRFTDCWIKSSDITTEWFICQIWNSNNKNILTDCRPGAPSSDQSWALMPFIKVSSYQACLVRSAGLLRMIPCDNMK